MPIDMSLFFPRQRLWPSLTWIGGRDWLRLTPLPGFTSRLEIDSGVFRDPQAIRHHELLGGLVEGVRRLSRKDGGDFITSTYIGSKAFAVGPKVFSPSLETCAALEHVSLDFPWSEFRLPYPSLVVEFPRAWAERIVRSYGLEQTPVAAMIGKVGPDQVHLWVRHAEGGELRGTTTNRHEHRSVEEIMRAHEDHGSRKAASARAVPISQGERLIKRVTVNLAVLLAHCGTKELGWVDAGARFRHERGRGRRGAALAHGDLMRVGQADPIKVFSVVKSRSGPDEAMGANAGPGPHWRRGHWRMQPCGEGRTLRRRVFIAPAFVCGDMEDIDPSRYSVRYEEGRP